MKVSNRVRRLRHPITVGGVREFIVHSSWKQLAVRLLVGVVLWSAILAVAYELCLADRLDGHTYFYWVGQVFLFTMSFPTGGTLPQEMSGVTWLVAATTSVGGVVVPALITAAVVIKLFIPRDMLIFRNKVCLTVRRQDSADAESGSHHLAVRLYSGSRLRLFNVKFGAVIRVVTLDDSGGVILRNIPLETANPEWLVATPHFPYSLMIPLQDGDFDSELGSLNRIQGVEIGEHALLVILAEGTIPELGTTFTEIHDYELPEDFSAVDFSHIEFDDASGKWGGWSSFDER